MTTAIGVIDDHEFFGAEEMMRTTRERSVRR